MEKIINFFKKNIFWFILIFVILTILTAYFIYKADTSSVIAIWTIVIAISTCAYAFYSRKTIYELKKQNELFMKKDKDNYTLERKSLVKKLLKEINYNELLLNEIKENFGLMGNISDKEELKEFISIYKKIADERLYDRYKVLYLDNSFKLFLKKEIEFKDNDLSFEINNFYQVVRRVLRAVLLVDLGIEEIKNEKEFNINNVKLKILRLIKKINLDIDESLELANVLYEKFKKEINYDFKNSNYYLSP